MQSSVRCWGRAIPLRDACGTAMPMMRPGVIYVLSIFFVRVLCAAESITASQTVSVQGPLTHIEQLGEAIPRAASRVRVSIIAPDSLPSGMGVGFYVSDRHGEWFGLPAAQNLRAGENTFTWTVDAQQPWVGEPHRAAWNTAQWSRIEKHGVYFWSASAEKIALTVRAVEWADQVTENAAPSLLATPQGQLRDIQFDGQQADGRCVLKTGVRWSLRCLPDPFPANPFAREQFHLQAILTNEQGKELRISGFALEPYELIDRGDKQIGQVSGAMHFALRWRPQIPGTWRGRLEATWGKDKTISYPLPPLIVEGEPWDNYVRVDERDKRFFSKSGEHYWPIGFNLHSTFDRRSLDRLGTVLTPERGTEAYAARFRRMAAVGCNATEIWMASWNIGFEWHADWPGFGGIGYYNQFHAAKMERILDDAHAHGICVNLVLNNHGQASPQHDREWRTNPWSKEHGGPLAEPYQLFTNATALAGQKQLREYIIARFADHPAIMGWKLYSEINLTAMGDRAREEDQPELGPMPTGAEIMVTRTNWHRQAAQQFAEMDIYRHPVTTHWSSDYRKPYPEICALPEIDYLCIDAYYNGDRSAEQNNTLMDLIYFGTMDTTRGLGRYKKPVWVTEFGGSSQGGSSPALVAELATAGWSAMTSGNAGMPMMWWFEWIDQADRWQPFSALSAFVRGEDFRGENARGVVLANSSKRGVLWSRAWVRPGKMLGYVADHEWAATGENEPELTDTSVRIGASVSAGPCRVAWWDADRGIVIKTDSFVHAGGVLDIRPPAFKRHIAFKLTRSN
jgi:hypothetical protein